VQDVEFGFGGLGGEYPGGGYNEDDGPGWQLSSGSAKTTDARCARRKETKKKSGTPRKTERVHYSSTWYSTNIGTEYEWRAV